jgi:hypothetical protein
MIASGLTIAILTVGCSDTNLAELQVGPGDNIATYKVVDGM